jgi:hypothetical protein
MKQEKPCVHCTLISAIHALEDVIGEGEHEPLDTLLRVAADMAYRIDRLSSGVIYHKMDEWQKQFEVHLRYHRAHCYHFRDAADNADDDRPF